MIVMEIKDIFTETEKINIYQDGNATTYIAGDKPYEEILTGWNSLLDGSHEMPAYGVSLDKETVKAMKNGLWVEFDFGKLTEYNGMPFEKLLVEVGKEFYGFNIIRYTSERGYDGRCFYIDLVNKNMSDFYNILMDI